MSTSFSHNACHPRLKVNFSMLQEPRWVRNDLILAPTCNAIYAISVAAEVPLVTEMIGPLGHSLSTDQYFLHVAYQTYKKTFQSGKSTVFFFNNK